MSPSFNPGLGRGLTFRRVSNRIAVAGFGASLVAFLIVAVTETPVNGRVLTLGQAVTAAIAVFLAWAIGRELDPDHPWVATASMAAAIVLVLLWQPAGLAVYAAMIAIRLVAGTTGGALGWFDLILIGGLGYGSGGSLATWSIAIVGFIALFAGREFARNRWLAIGVLGGGFAVAWYTGDLAPIDVSTDALIICAVIVAVTVVSVLWVDATVRKDARTGTVSAVRIRLARAAAGLMLVSATVIGGFESTRSLSVVAGALVAAALSSLWVWFGRTRSDDQESIEI